MKSFVEAWGLVFCVPRDAITMSRQIAKARQGYQTLVGFVLLNERCWI